jgi:ADP-heptose:LPS heptosyltransferase
MKIAVDGGGITNAPGKSFGNAIFVENFLKALSLYDKNNYFIYTFSDKQHILREKRLHFQTLKPSMGWMKMRLPFEEIISPKDIFLALNQALPVYTSGKKIVFSHGLSFNQYKHFYKKDYSRLKTQLENYNKKADFYSCFII